MHDLMLILAGAYFAYCWGVVVLYVASWGTFDANARFADRVAYALRWPVHPFQVIFVILYLMFLNKGSLAQRADAAQILLEGPKKKARPKPQTLKKPKGGGYVQ